MSIMLPGELDWILDLLGYNWPNIDEDKLFQCAQAWRDFAASVSEAEGSGAAAAGAVLSANSGEAVAKFGDSWSKFTGGFGHDSYLPDARVASEVIATAFDAAALAVIAGKVAVIAQLVALAVEVISAQAAAPFTFGLSEVGALGATQATRLIVRQLLDKLRKEVMEAAAKAAEHATMDAVKKMAKDFAKDYVKEQIKSAVVDAAKEKAVDAGKEMASNLGQQAIEQHFGARDGFDLGETAGIAKKAAGEYVQGIEDLADPDTHLDNLKNMPEEKLGEQLDKQGEQGGRWLTDQLDRAAGRDTAAGGDAAAASGDTASASSPESRSSAREQIRADFG